MSALSPFGLSEVPKHLGTFGGRWFRPANATSIRSAKEKARHTARPLVSATRAEEHCLLRSVGVSPLAD